MLHYDLRAVAHYHRTQCPDQNGHWAYERQHFWPRGIHTSDKNGNACITGTTNFNISFKIWLLMHMMPYTGKVPWGAFQYQKISLPKISLPKMSFGLVQSGWGESECFCKNLAPGSCEVFKDIFRAYRNAPLAFIRHCSRVGGGGDKLAIDKGGNLPEKVENHWSKP